MGHRETNTGEYHGKSETNAGGTMGRVKQAQSEIKTIHYKFSIVKTGKRSNLSLLGNL